MAQLFKNRANAIARLIIFGGPALFLTICAVLYAFGRSDFWTRVNDPLDQPVPFSHKHHVDGLGIDCRYCHTSVEQSSFAGLPSTAEGERDFHTRGCSGCHAPNSQIRAPLLEGIYGKPVPLSDGTIVIADEQYLRDSILLPNKQIAAGYEPVMPTFQGRISEEEVNAIVAYLKYLTDSERSQQ